MPTPRAPTLKRFSESDFPPEQRRFVTTLNDFLGSASDRLGQIPPVVVREITFTQPPRWTDATLTAPWGNVTGYDRVGYRKDDDGRVWFRGVASLGTYGPLPIFTLPASYAPSATQPLAAVQSNATFTPAGEITVLASGAVIASPITAVQTGVSARLSFVGLSFEASSLAAVPLERPLSLAAPELPSVAGAYAVACFDTTSGPPVASPLPSLSWSPSAGGIRIANFAGLAAGRTYQIRIALAGGA